MCVLPGIFYCFIFLTILALLNLEYRPYVKYISALYKFILCI